ncbi:hypothetical protein GIB67_033707 [Kingdonia uniflora]|uniref:NAD-dependent epimerase/dehydratase domain-containing protein n=1 Tax=Kingdonia uniflora TaxID=39325 RepID=A0A7J7P409_9MAGN|nr:hypothetical protein GIB67_033707 [Kingdonia uniflora]
MAEEKGKVCVTGAGGYVASWLVKLLLSKGYVVHGTVRNPAIEGCVGVFHVACPVAFGDMPNPEVEMIEPAVTGTLNVLKACSETSGKRVVVVSSVAAVLVNPSWPRDHVKDEACWSDKEYCRATMNWYYLAKTTAESDALEYAKENKLDVVTVCPSFVIGPMLQSTANLSNLMLITILRDGINTLENTLRPFVDVRDTAEALLLVYEKPEAEGRYICTSHMIRTKDLVDKLSSIYPNYNYPKNFSEGKDEHKLSSEKLQKLGWKYRPLEQILIDSIESFQDAGVISNN